MSNNQPAKSTDATLGCLGSWLLQPGDILFFLFSAKKRISSVKKFNFHIGTRQTIRRSEIKRGKMEYNYAAEKTYINFLSLQITFT